MPNKYNKGGKSSKKDAVKGLSNIEAKKREVLERLGMISNRGKAKNAIKGIVSYPTYIRWRHEDADFKEQADFMIMAIKEYNKDRAEEELEDIIFDDKQVGKVKADLLKNYLNTVGKDRGYTQKVETKIEGDTGGLSITYVVPKQIENIEEQDTIEIKGEEDGE
jgi:hypothetical protein